MTSQVSHLLLCMFLWTPNACSDFSKCQISTTTLMTFYLYNAPHVRAPSIQSTTGFTSIFLMLPWTLNAFIILWCNNTMPIHTTLHISDVQYSYFLCCTKFLFSLLYKIPIFSDVQYSCFPCSTIFPHNQGCTLVLFIM